MGSLPPSSSVSGHRRSAARAATTRPASAEPVKTSLWTPRWRTRASPIVSPGPCTTRTSPAGAPARRKSSSTRRPVSGVSSEGFRTTALPAATAEAAWVRGTPSGKFHAETMPTTPTGS